MLVALNIENPHRPWSSLLISLAGTRPSMPTANT
jgi:hypothetical protein